MIIGKLIGMGVTIIIMKMFDMFKSMNIDELAEWLDKHYSEWEAPWDRWFGKIYCKNCEPEIVSSENTDYHRDMEFGYCELHDKCKFFVDLENTPSNRQIIKMWLECEV